MKFIKLHHISGTAMYVNIEKIDIITQTNTNTKLDIAGNIDAIYVSETAEEILKMVDKRLFEISIAET